MSESNEPLLLPPSLRSFAFIEWLHPAGVPEIILGTELYMALPCSEWRMIFGIQRQLTTQLGCWSDLTGILNLPDHLNRFSLPSLRLRPLLSCILSLSTIILLFAKSELLTITLIIPAFSQLVISSYRQPLHILFQITYACLKSGYGSVILPHPALHALNTPLWCQKPVLSSTQVYMSWKVSAGSGRWRWGVLRNNGCTSWT